MNYEENGIWSESFQVRGPKKQDSHHTSIFEGHGAPVTSKTRNERIFECVDTPKIPNELLGPTTACTNAFPGPLSDFH